MVDLLKDCYNYFVLSLVTSAIFYFLLRKVFETCQVYYTILLLFIAFKFIFILKRICCLPKKPQ